MIKFKPKPKYIQPLISQLETGTTFQGTLNGEFGTWLKLIWIVVNLENPFKHFDHTAVTVKDFTPVTLEIEVKSL